MPVLDASVWVSRFLPEDAHHEASRAWLMRHAAGSEVFAAPAVLLAEVAGAIARRTDDARLSQAIVQQIRQLPALRLIAIDEELGSFAAEIAATYRLRGADALYVAVAQRLQLPLLSWNREQLQRSAGLVRAYAPNDEV